jgi:hypothetical protein
MMRGVGAAALLSLRARLGQRPFSWQLRAAARPRHRYCAPATGQQPDALRLPRSDACSRAVRDAPVRAHARCRRVSCTRSARGAVAGVASERRAPMSCVLTLAPVARRREDALGSRGGSGRATIGNGGQPSCGGCEQVTRREAAAQRQTRCSRRRVAASRHAYRIARSPSGRIWRKELLQAA